MKENKTVLVRDRNTEFIYSSLNAHIAKKYKADTPLDKAFVPYLMMLLCAIIDAYVFINLFELISYSNIVMIAIQTGAFIFAFDVIPIYLGIQLRRVKQRINKDKFLVYIALAVCLIAFGMNVALRLMTIDQLSDTPDASSQFFGAYAEEAVTDPGVDQTAIAMTIIGIGAPILTSIGSFVVSYMLYNPLKTRKRRLEELLSVKEDEVRRLDAILSEYDTDLNSAAHLCEDDRGKYNEKLQMTLAIVANYCLYVRQALKEHLADPAAISALSEESCDEILKRLTKVIAAVRAEPQDPFAEPTNKDKPNKTDFAA